MLDHLQIFIEKITIDLNDACIASEGQEARNIVQNLNQKSALKAFVEGLQNPIKLIIKASRFNNLIDAVEAACEEERNNKTYKGHSQQSNSKNNHFKKNIKCFKCGKPNHTADQCFTNSRRFPVYPNHSDSSRYVKTEANINTIQIICRYCKKNGHTIEECRKRKFNNSRQNNNYDSSNFNNSRQNNNFNSSNFEPNSNPQNLSVNARSNNTADSSASRPYQPGNDMGPSTSRGSATRARDIKTAY